MYKGMEPETFVCVTLASDHAFLTGMSRPLNEGELWAYLHKRGESDDQVRSLIEHARKDPL